MKRIEKIKLMNIEEMIEYLPITGYYCNVCYFYNNCLASGEDEEGCKNRVREWLEEEVLK